MRIAILQSSYIPWKGYFDLINSVDKFVLYDDTQYTRRDWRNRNKIKTKEGLKWLTIPVEVKGKYNQKINETKVTNANWAKKHWNTIYHNYSKSVFFNQYKDNINDLYKCTSNKRYLSEINYLFINGICDLLNINTELISSKNFILKDGRSERLLGICKDLNATEYISGSSAKNYLDKAIFYDAGIKITWFDYSDYREYPQLFPPFEHGVTILDLIFNVGIEIKRYMKSFL